MLTPKDKEEYQKRLEDLKSEHERLTPPKIKQRSNYIRYTHLGLEFLGIFLIFLFAGIKGDEYFQCKPLLLLLGLALGFGLGLYRLIKVANELANSD